MGNGIKVVDGSPEEQKTFDRLASFMKNLLVVATLSVLVFSGFKTILLSKETIESNRTTIKVLVDKLEKKAEVVYVDTKTSKLETNLKEIRVEIKQDLKTIQDDIKQNNKEMLELLRTLLKS